MKKFLFVIILFLLFPNTVWADSASENFWQIRAVDTMKLSRDQARDQETLYNIDIYIKRVESLHPNYIAINTPYDEEFVPVLTKWVDLSRQKNLKVWFRGNFSGWEGWFNYPKLKNPNEHHKKIAQFIADHPNLFKDGDIFTPAPEAENGLIGDPRQSSQKAAEYNAFLVQSYNNCVQSFKKINKNVTCGYFSMNGDVAMQSLTKDTVKKTGNVVVIDHYVKDPKKLSADILKLSKKFDAKIILGEFGAPILDIHGPMSDKEQAEYLKEVFISLSKISSNNLWGINYWTAFEGSTALFSSNYTEKPAAAVVRSFYQPVKISAKVTDPTGEKISQAKLSSDNISPLFTNDEGTVTFLYPSLGEATITIQKDGFEVVSKKFSTDNLETQQIVLQPSTTTFIYKLKLFWASITKFFRL